MRRSPGTYDVSSRAMPSGAPSASQAPSNARASTRNERSASSISGSSP